MQLPELDALDWIPLPGYAALALAWFSPALFTGRLLGPGDGLIESLPNYLAGRTLWEPLLGTGYPAAADPLTFTWYPPAILLSQIPGSYNAFVICAYVLASWFSYLFVRSLTGSRFAGWMSGLLYGFSGFMMAHTGHPSMIHAAAWIPGVLLGLERLRGAGQTRWFGFGCFAVAGLVLSGHPQIMLYGLVLAALYAVARGLDSPSRYRDWVRGFLMFACGIGLGAVLLVPLLEFTRLTVREHVTFDTFNSYHLPWRNLVLLFFPYLFGGEEGNLFGERWSVDTERDVFLGMITLLLAALAFVRRRRPAPVYFFLGVAAVALVCSLGGDGPLGRLLFQVPLFNQFRVQSRFLVVFQLAMAVLAGIGTAALENDRGMRQWVLRLGGAMLLLEIAFALLISQVLAARMQAWAAFLGFPDVPFNFTAPALAVPLIGSIAGLAGVLLFAVDGGRKRSMGLLSLIVIADLAGFGLFATWRYYGPKWKDLEPPPTAGVVRSRQSRFLTARGFLGKRAELPPNLSKLWGLASLDTYGSLAIERYHRLLSMDSGGTLTGSWWDHDNRAMDLSGAGYLIAAAGDVGEMGRFERMPMPFDNLAEDFGAPSDGGVFRETASVHLDGSRAYSTVAMVSFLRAAFDTPQDTPVLEMRFKAPAGDDVVIAARAGRETAELFASCPSIAPRMRHQLATVFSSFDEVRRGEPCQAHRYFAKWPVAPGRHFTGLELKWLLPAGGMQIAKLVLWNKDTGDIRVLSGADFQPDRFQEITARDGARIYKNLRAMPRAWLVSEAISMTGEEAKQSIQASRLPDGRVFDPAKTALVEDFGGMRDDAPATSSASVVDNGKSSVEIRTRCDRAAFLVLADLYYPGWQATVNGSPTPIIQTNYVQRGVMLPKGDNLVRFVYRPGSLYLGIGISLISLAAALALPRLMEPA